MVLGNYISIGEKCNGLYINMTRKIIADGLKSWKVKLETIKPLKYGISLWPQGWEAFLKWDIKALALCFVQCLCVWKLTAVTK